MGLVEKAERTSLFRVILFYLLALSLLASTILSIANGHDQSNRLLAWFALMGLTALNLTSVPFLWGQRRLSALMNDETTRDHRRSSLATGFWAMLLATAATITVSFFIPLSAITLGRIVVTAGLTAALIAFSTLELRASR
ncbi:hypothetical protein ACQR50_00600 [Sphingomonas sp. Xoc002]|uniref:hypothetical protein n=1 Tax=Sphingomonas sp. Xoc002 TaxID=2837624 RepID=UPI003D172D40